MIKTFLKTIIATFLISCLGQQALVAGEDNYDTLMKEITPLQGTQPAQWRLIWKEQPQTTATISWTTEVEGKEHILFWDTESRNGDVKKYKNKLICQRHGILTDNPKEYAAKKADGEKDNDKKSKIPLANFTHHAYLDNLKPATTYYVVLSSDGNVSREFYFTTAPEDDVPLTIIFGGDSRSGHGSRAAINVMIRDTVKERNIVAFFHGGDYIGSGKSWSQWRLWLSHHELTTGKDGRLIPIIPARGNHDGGYLFNAIFDFPENDQNYYETKLSAAISILTLNTEISVGGEQQVWLDKTAAEIRPQRRWLLAQYHRPLWPAVKGPARHQQLFTQVFEKYNFDLCLEADGHNIKRTVPIRDGKEDPTGVVYIGEGGLGVGQRTPDTERWYLKSPGMASKGHHITILQFGKKELKMEVLRLEGGVADEYTFKAR